MNLIYGYQSNLVVDHNNIMVGLSPTYPLREGLRLVRQCWIHQVGDYIKIDPGRDPGYLVEADVCTRGT